MENRQDQHGNKNEGTRRQQKIAYLDCEPGGEVARCHEKLPDFFVESAAFSTYALFRPENIKS